MQSSISSFFVGVPGGLIMSCIAFSIVFIVIMGLMFVMMGMKHVCSAIDNVGKAKAAAPAPAAPAPAAAPAAPAGDDGELLAVISAAVAAACGATARVVAFAPVKAPAPTAWKSAGRFQNTEGC